MLDGRRCDVEVGKAEAQHHQRTREVAHEEILPEEVLREESQEDDEDEPAHQFFSFAISAA